MSATDKMNRAQLIATLELYGFEPASKMRGGPLKTIGVAYRRADMRMLRAEKDDTKRPQSNPRAVGWVGVLSKPGSLTGRMVDEGGTREPREWKIIPELHLRLMVMRLQQFNAKEAAKEIVEVVTAESVRASDVD